MIIQPKHQTTDGHKSSVIEAKYDEVAQGSANVDCSFNIRVALCGPNTDTEYAAGRLVAGLDQTVTELRRVLRDLHDTREALAGGGYILGQAQLPTPKEPPTEEDRLFSSSLQANREAIRSEQLKEVEPILTWARGQIFDASSKPYLHKLYLSVHHEVGRDAILEMVRRAGLQAYGCPGIQGGHQDGHMEYKNKAKLICTHHVCVHLPEI